MPNRTKLPEVDWKLQHQRIVERGPFYEKWDGESHNVIYELNALGACAKRAG